MAKDPSVIIRPTDPIRRKQLKLKLKEYRIRIAKHEGSIGSVYKAEILSRLLRRGKVSTDKLRKKILKENGYVIEAKFLNSCDVIRDYCLTGGRSVSRGGLPDIPES
jgi:hypothetical protein